MDPFIAEQSPEYPVDPGKLSSGEEYLACLSHERQHVVGQLDARRVCEAAARGLDGYSAEVTGLSAVTPNASGTRTVMLIAPAPASGLRTTVRRAPRALSRQVT